MFRKKKETTIRRDQVETLDNRNAHRTDSNKDGIPDYLQRPEIASLVKTNKDLNQWEVDTENEVEQWVMGLRGYEFDSNSNSYVPASPPVINEIGAKQLQTHVRSVVNKHGINTSLTTDEVHQICLNASSTLARLMKYKYLTWKISKSDMSAILWQFDNLTYLVLSRAVDDRQRRHTSERTKLTGSTSNTQGGFPG